MEPAERSMDTGAGHREENERTRAECANTGTLVYRQKSCAIIPEKDRIACA
jgi:hypothetical protein